MQVIPKAHSEFTIEALECLKNQNLALGSEQGLPPQEHVSYECEGYIKKILAPLTSIAGIHYFCYGVNLPDTQGFTLHTNAKYYESWFLHKLPLTGFYLSSGWYFIDPALPTKQQEIAYSMGIGNIITLVSQQRKKTEIFEFGTCPDNRSIINFYLNDHNLLTKFIYTFREKAQIFIEKAYTQLITPDPQRIIKDNSLAKGYLAIRRRQEEIPQELIYPFNLLSNRESECFSLLVRGYSNVEISEMFNSSPKTVNGFLTRIKEKLGCTSRQALVRKAHDVGLVDYYLLYQER